MSPSQKAKNAMVYISFFLSILPTDDGYQNRSKTPIHVTYWIIQNNLIVPITSLINWSDINITKEKSSFIVFFVLDCLLNCAFSQLIQFISKYQVIFPDSVHYYLLAV